MVKVKVKCDACGSTSWTATKFETLETRLRAGPTSHGFQFVSGGDAIRWRFACHKCGSVASDSAAVALYELVHPEDRVFRDQRDEADDLADDFAAATFVVEPSCPHCGLMLGGNDA